MADSSDAKWEGKVTAELKGITADQVWPFFADFCNVHKCFPDLEQCYKVEGEEGKAGLIRYVASVPQPSFAVTDGNTFPWAKEKLVLINPIERCLSYEILENNVGVKSHVATFKILAVEDGCRIEWSLVGNPIEGIRFEDYQSFRRSLLQAVATNIQTLLSFSS